MPENIGDHIQVGNISNAKGIAIGAGAQVYNYEYQVNLPPELIKQILSTSTQAQKEDYEQLELKTETWEPETLLVSSGPFLMGSNLENNIPNWETPQFTADLPSYRIGKYPVTNAQFARFIQETERFVPQELGWQNGNQPTIDQNELPVMGVTWYDALAYCVWLIKETDRPYTLPSETQWEKAARGIEGNLFPWGNEWQDGSNCNNDPTKTTKVGAFPHGKSPLGCFDMVGNVREWTTTLWGRNRRVNLDKDSLYPWDTLWKPNEGLDQLNVNRQIRRVTRGGAALVSNIPLRATRRTSELPYRCGVMTNRVGFRVALNWED